MGKYIREPINGFTHLGGAILSFAGLLALVIKTTLISASAVDLTAVIIFGISMILLYTASATYHLVVASDKVIAFLRKLDHSMIFILIAGSYTPFCLLALTGAWQISIITIIWSLAIIGITLKVFWINMPRWISTGFYIGMGWVAVLALSPLSKALNTGGLTWLALGGIMYTIGGIIYGLKKPNISKTFGFHELFHIFVMLGSACHYWCVFNYVL